MEIQIKKVGENAKLPEYAHQGDAGMDLFSLNATTIEPKQRVLIQTGIAMAIPSGFVGLIWDKSGRAAKIGLKTMGGVVDSGYRGEVKVICYNTSDIPITINAQEKVAQLLIQKVESPTLKQVQEFQEEAEPSRGEGGFGSTGLQ